MWNTKPEEDLELRRHVFYFRVEELWVNYHNFCFYDIINKINHIED
jgi:hypothetical protein